MPEQGLDACRATVASFAASLGAGGRLAITAEDNLDASEPPLIALLFAAGARPSAADVSAIAERSGEFSVVYEPPPGEGWVEALVTGLSFEISGLRPAGPASAPAVAHRFGLASAQSLNKLQAIVVRPGPHLAFAPGERGWLVSEGLAFFTGQEIALAALAGALPGDDVKLAARLVHELVTHGPLRAPVRLSGPNGEPLLAEPSADGGTVSIRRQI
ncbi:MAG: hypothetical protein LC648_03895 [Novosphingobium sp.]|nr:hypothetical protein [Novosphingobium sp.]